MHKCPHCDSISVMALNDGKAGKCHSCNKVWGVDIYRDIEKAFERLFVGYRD